MRVTGFIFARGGSKGLPGKNTKPLCAKPLLTHAIEQARDSRMIDELVVSTDSLEIARCARDNGVEVLIRPPHLTADDSPEWLSWRHALENYPCDLFVSIPATAPLRLPEDIATCIHRMQGSKADVVLTVTEARPNPLYQCVEMASDYVTPAFGEFPLRRQDAPKLYNVCGLCYVAQPVFIASAESLWSGCVKAVAIPIERAVDIDTPLDFEWAEFLMNRREHGRCTGVQHIRA